jgi:hypothetical protein
MSDMNFPSTRDARKNVITSILEIIGKCVVSEEVRVAKSRADAKSSWWKRSCRFADESILSQVRNESRSADASSDSIVNVADLTSRASTSSRVRSGRARDTFAKDGCGFASSEDGAESVSIQALASVIAKSIRFASLEHSKASSSTAESREAVSIGITLGTNTSRKVLRITKGCAAQSVRSIFTGWAVVAAHESGVDADMRESGVSVWNAHLINVAKRGSTGWTAAVGRNSAVLAFARHGVVGNGPVRVFSTKALASVLVTVRGSAVEYGLVCK